MIVKCDFCSKIGKRFRNKAALFHDKEYSDGKRVQNRKDDDELVTCTVCGKENKI